MKCASREYGISWSENSIQEDDGLVVENPERSWAGMRRMLLAHGAYFAQEYKDSKSIAR